MPDLAAKGNALREAADSDGRKAFPDELADEDGRVVGFECGAEGQHQFPYLALRKPVLEPFEIQFVGIPVVQRAEQTAEDELLPPVEAASVHGHHAVPVSDEAQDILRTRGVLADGADIGRGKASAAPADM